MAADGRPGDHDAVDRPKNAAFAERSNPSLDPICGSQQLAGFKDQDCAPERVDGGQPVGEGELVEDFDAATPCQTGDRAFGTCPRPGFGGFAVAVFDECPRVEPVRPEVLGFTGVGDPELASCQQRSPEGREVDVVHARPGAEVDLGRAAVICGYPE